MKTQNAQFVFYTKNSITYSIGFARRFYFTSTQQAFIDY